MIGLSSRKKLLFAPLGEADKPRTRVADYSLTTNDTTTVVLSQASTSSSASSAFFNSGW